ncbi:MAG: M15 family peptidase [gamma proteobacterium symbiont of Taylorina sp.]|nr:M15 family peptidase [gamma proteobacterium symbiont of Taylorina sp.]
MSELLDKQHQFTRAYPLLMLYAQYLGYELSDGDAYRDSRCQYGHPDSTHRSRLARDFNIFDDIDSDGDEDYLEDEEAEEAFNLLHDFWDMLGGSERIKNDLRHFSFEHKGVR